MENLSPPTRRKAGGLGRGGVRYPGGKKKPRGLGDHGCSPPAANPWGGLGGWVMLADDEFLVFAKKIQCAAVVNVHPPQPASPSPPAPVPANQPQPANPSLPASASPSLPAPAYQLQPASPSPLPQPAGPILQCLCALCTLLLGTSIATGATEFGTKMKNP